MNAVDTGKYRPSLLLAFKIARLFELRIEDAALRCAALRPMAAAGGAEGQPAPANALLKASGTEMRTKKREG